MVGITAKEVSMKHLRNVLLVALLLLVAFSGFAQKKATVRFLCIEADLPKDFRDKFMAANPDIDLVREEEDWTKWMADAMAGNAADLQRMGNGTDIAYYSARGLLYDMTKLMKSSKVIKMDDIDMGGCSTYLYDGKEFGKGKWYGLPKDYNNIGCITYNKEMFKAAGIAPLSETVPITYMDDLYNLSKKLTKKDSSGKVIVYGYDYNDAWIPYLVSDMATASGLSIYSDPQRSVMNNDPRVREFFKYFARFSKEDIAHNVRNPSPGGWNGPTFQSDRAAMVQLGYWFGAQLLSNPGYETKYGWAPTPILKKGSPRVTDNLGATGVTMYAKTKVAKQAFRVFEWYMGGEYGIERARTGWGIPPLKSLHKLLPEDNAYNKSRKVIALDDAKYFKPWQFSKYVTWTQFPVPWVGNIDELVKGNITVDQFIDKYYAGLNDLLKTAREEVGE
jgi:multiple sugar transport system substrate-binding protein